MRANREGELISHDAVLGLLIPFMPFSQPPSAAVEGLCCPWASGATAVHKVLPLPGSGRAA